MEIFIEFLTFPFIDKETPKEVFKKSRFSFLVNAKEKSSVVHADTRGCERSSRVISDRPKRSNRTVAIRLVELLEECLSVPVVNEPVGSLVFKLDIPIFSELL